jgi:hypothetical protein
MLASAGDSIPLMCQIVYDEYLIRYGAAEFEYVPWWADPEVNINGEFLDRPKVLKGTALSMFRENADLLYMLRTPDDQYLPHCRTLLDQWDRYPTGTVDFYIPVEGDTDEA